MCAATDDPPEMTTDLDRRTFDLLRLIERNEPVGSITLVDLMRRRGYSIGDRSVRLLLAELDDRGLTEKVDGRGRRITQAGRTELGRGNVGSRLAGVRSRIATLTSRVTYDPLEDAGTLAASAVYLDEPDLGAALSALAPLEDDPLGPCPVAVGPADPTAPRSHRIAVPSSLTVDGVLLSRGIDADLQVAGVVEYEADGGTDDEGGDGERAARAGGHIRRFVDVVSGERSSVDVTKLLVDAGWADVRAAVEGEAGSLVVDNREFPVTRFEDARDLAVAVRDALGGVVDVRRPREDAPFPTGAPGWEFGSLTYGGAGENAVALLVERGLAEEWETLHGTVDRAAFVPMTAAAGERGAL